MLDLKLIRDDPELVREGLRKKHADVGLVDRVLELDRRRREWIRQVEALRAEQNQASAAIPRLTGEERARRLAELREVADRLKALEPELKTLEERLHRTLLLFPNLPHPSVPPGRDASENVPLRTWGRKPEFTFPPLDHLDLGTRLGIIDMERGAKVAGSRFYYLKGAGVLLEQALMRFGLDLLVAEGFTPVVTPFLVRPEIITGAWGGAELDTQQVYRIEGEDLALIGTSEQSLAGMYQGETLEEETLPRRFAGISWNFRREAGSYGRDVRGLYRVHQFDKLEMFSYVVPERSWDEHEYLVSLEERFLQRLGLHHRVVAICGGDTSIPSAKTYDVETWMPGRGEFGETQSCSNCTDFQARRLGIRVRRARGTEYVHTLNGTLVATSRALIAVLENYQQPDGSVRIPEVLVPYMNGQEEIRP
ncbi:MAG: serine--tRNA ligase [Armatimonadota bacterium]|nr:serine--tRNA ligase [Armatimonadota bacterium]MDR7451006.1 serine--tRNA ligase [Armatimonadota bacterium]MDR7465973.1 serine--tRNA ligase [Armatimonadota bacterium]MDR7494038.1 serine--tRNA ligase [Armatimonadota bacterium]MDR7498488.1 serine--tRNA ligase [Armatimonadota bacterium]